MASAFGCAYFSTLLMSYSDAISRQLAYFALLSLNFVCLSIAWRFLQIKLGARIQPDRAKAILITGATSGIGLTIAKHFYALGFSVIAGYYNDQEPGYAELLHYGNEPYQDVCKRKMPNSPAPKLLLVKMDVRCKESIENSAKEVRKFLEMNDIKLHCLVNNAGIATSCPFEWSDPDISENLIETNLKGLVIVTRKFIKDIVSNGGRVINVSSATFVIPIKTFSIYGCTKSAVAYFSAALDEDLKHYGASSICVVPGNLITKSNILYSSFGHHQVAVNKLSVEEKNLYKKSIKDKQHWYKLKLKENLVTSGDNPEQVASSFKFDLPVLTETERGPTCIERLYRFMIGQISGEIGCNTTLEESGIAASFEDAVCLVRPPQTIFAGGWIYSNLIAPSLEWLPRVFYGSLAGFSSKVIV